MRLSAPQAQQLTDPAAERVRRSHATAIEELQTIVQGMDGGAGRLLRTPQVITASGRYTRAKGTAIIHVRMCGGGGGSGGAVSVGAVLSLSGSGASGTTLDFWLGGSDVNDADVVIGAGGTAGAAGNNPGGNGLDTTLTLGAAVYRAKGGGGGAGGAQSGTVGVAAGGNPIAGSTAGVPQTADPGDDGLIFTTAGGGGALSSRGGSGALGVGGFPTPRGFGAGGGASGAVNTSVPGTPGTAGVVIIEEYASAP